MLNLCIYRVNPENVQEFRQVLAKHQPALVAAGLSDDKPFQYWAGKSVRSGKVCFVELMHWKDERGPDIAHETPEVMAVWEPMGKLSDNDMEFIDVEPFTL